MMRPSRHVRRVRTKYGRRLRLINPSIKKKSTQLRPLSETINFLYKQTDKLPGPFVRQVEVDYEKKMVKVIVVGQGKRLTIGPVRFK